MPTINRWIGDAESQPQIERVLVKSVYEGAKVSIAINGKSLSYTVPREYASNVAGVSSAIRSLISSSAQSVAALNGITVYAVNGTDGEETGFDVYGADDGTPYTFTVTGSVSTKVTELVAGLAARNFSQVVAIPGVPTSGNFKLTFNGQQTANIAYNASAATVQSALEALSNIDVGDVTVSGSAGGPWTVEFGGRFAGQDHADVPAGSGAQGTGRLSFQDVSLAQSAYGASCRMVERGGGRKNSVHQVRCYGTPSGGTFDLIYKTYAATGIAYNASAATVQTALEALTSIGSGNVVVTGTFADGFRIEFVGALAGARTDRIAVASAVTGAAVVEVVRLTDGPELGTMSASRTYPAVLIAPFRDSATPSIVTVAVKNPATGIVSRVIFEDGESEDVVADRLNAIQNLSVENFIVTSVDDGYRVDVSGAIGMYQWGVSPGDANAEGYVAPIDGAEVSLLQQSATSSTRSWKARLHFESATTVTLRAPTSSSTWSTCTFDSQASQATIQAALGAALMTGVTVTATSVRAFERELTFTMAGGVVSGQVAPGGDITITAASVTLSCESVIAQQGELGTNSVIELGYNGFPSAGTVSISVTDETGANQAVTCTVGTEAADINTALGETAVRQVWRDDVTNSVWLEWVGPSYRGLQIRIPSVTANTLSGSTGVVSDAQVPQAAVYAEHELRIDNATGGTWKITLGGQQTGSITWNAEAGVVRSALEALSNVDPGDIAVYGGAGGPYRLVYLPEFGGGPDVTPPTIDGTSLTSAAADMLSVLERQAATGPAHFDNADNWSLGMPATGQTLLFANTSRSVLYGLEYASITPDRIIFEASFTGACGLPDYLDDVAVTLPKELTLGTNGAGTMTVEVGRGDGSGSSRIRLNTGGKQTLLIVRQSAQGGEAVAVQWRGTHASNAVEVYRGSVGIGMDLQAATVSTLKIGYVSAQESDAMVFVGDQVTLGEVTKNGGVAVIWCGFTTLNNIAGNATVEGTGAVTNVNGSGGTVFYNSTGALGTAKLSNAGVLSFNNDLRVKTVTNAVEVYGDEAEVVDSNMVVTNLVVKYSRTTRQPNLGVNYQIARTVL